MWLWVILSTVLVLCADAVAVPVGWFVYQTYQAGEGEADPEAAVTVYVLKLAAGEELGVSRVLAGDRRDELLEQWRDYRDEMERGDPPSKFEITEQATERQGDDRAAVTVHIGPVWFYTDGSTLALHGTAYPWQFEVRRERRGWRLWSVEAPAWCGVYLRADACG